ncbi:MAG: SLC13 family permease [Pseudomonadota bacterium]
MFLGLTNDQLLLFGLVLVLFGLLIWGRIRYDVVAFGALVAAFLLGVIPKDEVFSGFGHPAVVIIALVLIVSRGLSRSGAIELLARRLLSASHGIRAHIGIMGAAAAALSTVMNNVAALALLMPVDIQAARRAKRSPALTLMPLSFASILGGMVTLIGTPPNIVIATFREDALGEAYSMFDFAPVGLAVSVVGVLFVVLVGFKLIPVARGKTDSGKDLAEFEDFIAEASLKEDSPVLEQPLETLDELALENEVELIGLVRRGKRLPGTGHGNVVKKSDLIVLEGAPDNIDRFIGAARLSYVGQTTAGDGGAAGAAVDVIECVVPKGSRIDGRTADDVQLLYRQGVSLIGVSRSGQRTRKRLRRLTIRPGDILLLLGPSNTLNDVVGWLGCLPLADRGLEMVQRSKAALAVALFAAAILAASVGWVYLPVALGAVVVGYVAFNIVPLSELFDAVEWPVVVLLGSMIPIGVALEVSGGTEVLANALVGATQGWAPIAVLAALMVITMTLSDVLNNVATALIAAPIAIDVANRLNANPDAFLMGVAVAASCAFLTPIGHKNNTLILGPGGYRFGDYWRMGLPLEILVLVVSIPVIAIVWPL